MTKRKTLQDLTIRDNFMFGAVMSDEENCRLLLERILEIPIGRVEVERERSITYHPVYKGVRLDVYAKDEKQTRYNIEMQVLKESEPGKRSRYYHSQIDMELLVRGTDYKNLPNAYVIFICDYDPFGLGKYRYIFRNSCEDAENAELSDGSYTIFLNAHGKDDQEISKELANFLDFVKRDSCDMSIEFTDEYVKRIQRSIYTIKQSREMGERFMLLEIVLRNEWLEGREEGRAEGRAEMLVEFLENMGRVPEDVRTTIMEEPDLDVLRGWGRLATKVSSLEEFIQKMK